MRVACIWLTLFSWMRSSGWGTAGQTLNDSSLLGEATFPYAERLLNTSGQLGNRTKGFFLLDFDEGLLEDWRSLANKKSSGKESQDSGVKALLVSAYSLIIVISLFGNSLVCHVVVKTKRTQSSTSLFILNHPQLSNTIKENFLFSLQTIILQLYNTEMPAPSFRMFKVVLYRNLHILLLQN